MIERIRKASSSDILRGLLCALTAAFYIGAIFSPDLPEIFTGFWKIITNPAVLTKDYFFSEIGSVSGTMLNFALTGTFFCALMFLPGANITGVTVAAYGLSVGFCSYGINFLNILPFQVGILLYSRIKKMPFVKNLNLAMFSCALGPLVIIQGADGHACGNAFTVNGDHFAGPSLVFFRKQTAVARAAVCQICSGIRSWP